MAQGTTDRITPAGHALRRQTAKLIKKPHVKAGFPEGRFEKPHKDSPLSVGEIAVVQEFGTIDGRVPERSFVRSAYDQNNRDYTAITERLKLKVLTGKTTVKRALGLIGLRMEQDIRDKITEGGVPFKENAPSTIAAKTRAGKKGDRPLINTGQMRQSVTSVVVGAD